VSSSAAAGEARGRSANAIRAAARSMVVSMMDSRFELRLGAVRAGIAKASYHADL
jgi:hypothetical protein